MERCDVSCAKRAGVLSEDEIREIVMDSDRDEDKNYASQESGVRRGDTPTFATVFHLTACSPDHSASKL